MAIAKSGFFYSLGIRINSDAFFITHTYEANNGNLKQSVYGNGVTYKLDYDSLDRIVSASYNGVEQYNISYGADGRIGLYNDLAAGVTWRYEYAKDGSVTSAICSNGTRLYYTYDTATGKLLSCKVYDGSTSKTTSYTYHKATDSNGKKNLIDYVTLPNDTKIDYDYDGFYRASYDIEVDGSAKVTTDYTFRAGSESGTTSMMVSGLTNAGNGWSSTLNYTYDANGNIATIKEGSTLKATYHYDSLNQLVREDNAWLNKTIVYTYDLGGNILTVKEYAYTTASSVTSSATKTVTYTYGESNWKDKLTKYNGVEISYDEIGNRTSYNGYTYTWENGRQLAGISGNSNTITYKYNSNGIRTQKTVNGVTTNYILEGSNVVKETNSTDTLWFYYDATGSVISFELNGTTYFYVKNLQGDIIAIADANGNKVVEYVYDSWGKLISITGSLASTIGVMNPYRYRSYRYDTETGLYYLQSRYYDPEMKRFINADGYVSTGQGILGNNMFAYCGNNPVNRNDYIGRFWDAATSFSSNICSIAYTDAGSSSTLNVGSASPYVPSNSTDYNCYAYVLGETQWKYVGGSSDAITNFDVDNVTQMVLKDAEQDGRSIRIIDSYNAPIESNEYRIALRTGAGDYHFMVQHSDGTWSHKPSHLCTRLIDAPNPTVASWDLPRVNIFLFYACGTLYENGSIKNYYDSETVYFAVTK